jgi:hypothetical protein
VNLYIVAHKFMLFLTALKVMSITVRFVVTDLEDLETLKRAVVFQSSVSSSPYQNYLNVGSIYVFVIKKHCLDF